MRKIITISLLLFAVLSYAQQPIFPAPFYPLGHHSYPVTDDNHIIIIDNQTPFKFNAVFITGMYCESFFPGKNFLIEPNSKQQVGVGYAPEHPLICQFDLSANPINIPNDTNGFVITGAITDDPTPYTSKGWVCQPEERFKFISYCMIRDHAGHPKYTINYEAHRVTIKMTHS